MDVEARRKYCGLLMFEASPTSARTPTSRNNEINSMPTRGVDASPLMHHQLFVNQDCLSQAVVEFPLQQTRALAAGAAAGDDVHHAAGTYSSADGANDDPSGGKTSSVPGGGAKMQPPKRTPRPPNAFILYRRAKQPAIIAAQRHLSNAEVSRQISDMWRSESEETRLEWERYADRKKLEHMQTYPNYVYRPNKSKSKVDKRRQQRRQAASRDSSISSTDPKSPVDGGISTTGPGPVRRKSTKNANRPTAKLDMPTATISNNGHAGFVPAAAINAMTPPLSQPTTPSIGVSSHTTMFPNPEMSLLTTHFTAVPEELVRASQHITSLNPTTPLTPLSPPSQMLRGDLKIRQQFHNSLMRVVPPEEEHLQNFHIHQGAPHFSLQSINGLAFHHVANNPHHPNSDPLFCFVPDVEQTQQQMIAEYMLHHQSPHETEMSTPSVPSSTMPNDINSDSPSPTTSSPLFAESPDYFPNGTNTSAVNAVDNSPLLIFRGGFAEFDENNYLGGSVNHHHHHVSNGLSGATATGQYL